ncbi:MAG: hypothetical protein NTV70_17875 [Acidobacteria bacterium]|nr:hypothetical protein [Acidobacteriota bacterium]
MPVHELARYLPAKDAVVVSIDVKALRSAGLLEALAGSRVTEESDYRSFVDITGFDYRTDLDALLYSSSNGNIYLLASGRFDWNAITSYASGQGASCRYAFCRMRSSQAGKWLSFFPLRSNVVGFAVSQDELAALELQQQADSLPSGMYSDPASISLPARVFKSDAAGVPASLTPWFKLLAGAQSARFGMGLRNGDFEIKMRVDCPTPASSAEIAQRLNEGLRQLREASAANVGDAPLTGLPLLLSRGDAKQEDRAVVSTWSVSQGFLESLLSGRI